MDLGNIGILDFTPSVLLGVAILLILTGRLIPRFFLDRADCDAERWKKAYETAEEARRTSDAQVIELLEMSRTAHAIITAMSSTSEKIRQSGAFDGPP